MSAARPGPGRRGNALLRPEGDYWTVAYGGRIVRLRDAKGLRYLAQLLWHPGREFLAVELITGTSREHQASGPAAAPQNDGSEGCRAAERARKAVTNRIRDTVARIGTAHEHLGRHLANAVRTGHRCVYTPERPVQWRR